jgi:rubredoxin
MQTSDDTRKEFDLSKKFSILNLPSKGVFYSLGRSYIFVKYLSYDEENILSDDYLMSTEEGIKMVLKNIILDDISIEDLLPGDVQAISMFLYSTSFGDKIDVDVRCPVCSNEDKKKVAISEFNFKKCEVNPDKDRMFHLVMPQSKLKMTLKMPSFFDEYKQEVIKGDAGYINKLLSIITSIDGVFEKSSIETKLRGMPILDSRYLRSFLDKNVPGVDTSIKHACSNCGYVYSNKISAGHNFLRLPPEYANIILEEMFLCTEYGNNISWDSLIKMPTPYRKWVLKRIQKEIKKKNEQIEKERNAASSSSKTKRFSR